MTDIHKQLEELNIKETVKDAAKAVGRAFTKHSTQVLGVVEEGFKFLSKTNIPFISQAAGIFSWGADRAKDLMVDVKFDALATSVGDLQDGLNNVNAKVEAQGKALAGAIDGVKSELEGQLKQQGEKFDEEIKRQDAKISALSGEQQRQAQETKKALQKQKQELESAINEVTENLNRVHNKLKKEINDLRDEVNERFENCEEKIQENKRKIEEERIKREEEIREVKDNIKLTKTNLENLRKEKEQLEDEMLNHQAKVNRQTTETQQAFEDAQAEYERRTKIIETQIEDNQETIEEFNEQLNNVQREQARQKLEQEEIVENLQETNDLLFTQQHKLNLVANQMEEIHEEVHERMDKLSQKLDDRTNETLNITKDTSEKLDKLTEQVQNIQKDTEELQEQIKKNKEELEKAKKEAKLANERLDNLLKLQTLSDFSAEQSKLDKIQKSLELKAEETKLLATLNLLQETKKLVRVELSEINWKVGIKEGKEKDLPRPEGMLLNPNSSWAKKYSPEQLREWGWDTRLLGEHETAPLTDEEKRKEKQAPQNEQDSKAAGEESTQTEEAIEKIEKLKTETLERLSAVQAEIRTGLEEIKNSPSVPPSVTKQKTQQLQASLSTARAKLSKEKEWELWESEKGIENYAKDLEKKLSDPSLQFEQEIEKYEETIAEEKQEEVKRQWQTIQALSKQVLQEQPEEEQEEKEQKEEDLDKKIEELVQQLKEMEQTEAASQKTMTYAMLFLIIFLLEYIVYKRNGLPGLVVLNIILLICYWYKDQLMEYADLWGKYLLIIGYVMGNVLAYSAPEQEKYKWPSVVGFNLAVLAIYAYTLYQQKQEQAKIEAHYQQKTKEITEQFNLSEEWKDIQQNSQPQSGIGGIIDEYSIFSNSGELRIEQLEKLKEVNLEKQIIQQKEQEIAQQVETLQKAAEIEKNLAQASEGLGSPRMTWTKIKEIYPQFENKSILLEELAKVDRLLAREEKETDQAFLTKLIRLPIPSEEEYQLLSQLHLTVEQFITLSTQAQYLTREEQEILPEIYPTLDTKQKLQLINSGLNNLGINTFEKKEKFVELNHALYQEQQLFGLTTKEKENILRFLTNTLNLSPEQRESLEGMGISFFNASEWTITKEQKDHLLDFGLNKLTLTEEQAEQLAVIHPDQFKTFSLTGEQKNILNSLAPLTREDKYSEASLDLFFQEIKIVETDKGEKSKIRIKPWFKNSTINFLVQEEIIPGPHTAFGTPKSSYLPLKIKFLGGEQKILRVKEEAKQKKSKGEEIKQNKLSIIRSLVDFMKETNDMQWGNWEEVDLPRKGYTLNEWVNLKALTNWQVDILLTCGFKTIPKYNFFELLIFCVEKFTESTWAEFLNDNKEVSNDFNEYVRSLKYQPITINQNIWEKFASSQSPQQKEVIQQFNLKELIQEQVNQTLGNWKPTEIPEKKSEGTTSEEPKEQPQPSSSTSRYDDLFANLNKEEAERQCKKLEREESQKKLQENERKRREEKLSEKDRKLKEDEERRAAERELTEQEEQKRRQAEEARNKSLQAEQEALFKKKQANIEEAKRRAEEVLANQIKQNEIQEKRKRNEIEKMEKENQAEQERLVKQAQLIEEEKQKKLASISLEDKEERQRIEKRANEEKARIQTEMNEKKRKNDEEVSKQRNQLLKEKSEKELQIKKLQDQVNLQRTLGEENNRLARQQEQILREAKGHQNQLEQYRKQLWNAVLDYYWIDDETKAGTRNPQQSGSGTLRKWLSSYPNMEFNLNFGDIMSDINWSSYRTAMQAFYRTAGKDFVNQTEFQRLLRNKCQSLKFLD